MEIQIVNEGYAKFRDADAFKFLDINTVNWSDQGTIPLQMVIRSPEVSSALLATQNYLGEKYIRPIFGDYQCDYVDLVKGMDDNVYEWHNDYEPNKVNLGILLYYSDTDADTGSGIGFRDPKTKIEHAFFYPKEGDICIINHTEKFEHRVTKQHIPLPRIVASFHYYVYNLKNE